MLGTRITLLATVAVIGLVPVTAATAQPSHAAPAPRPAGVRDAPAVAGGTRLWVARFQDGNTQLNYASSVVASPESRTVFVTGLTERGNAAHMSTLAYDAGTGATRWTARYYGLGYSYPIAMAVSPDGSKLFVTGFTTSSGACCPDQMATVAYDAATGRTLWTRIPFVRGSSADSVAVSPDGSTVFVTGVVGSPAGIGYIVTVAYDAATGALRWTARSTSPVDSLIQRVAVSPDGQLVFVTGAVKDAAGNPVIMTAAYNAATGARVWSREYPGTGAEVAVSPDGATVYTTGSVTGASGHPSFVTLAYDAVTGTRRWVRLYGGTTVDSVPNAVAVSPDGQRVFVTGYSSTSDFATVAYDAAGNRLWVSLHHVTISSGFRGYGGEAIGVSPDGREVFVTGYSTGSNPNDFFFVTVGYAAATGATSWVARYGGPRKFGVPTSLAVTPDGQRVVVTGFSGGSQGCCDFATVAYAP